MIVTTERQIINQKKSMSDRTLPVVIKWKGFNMVRTHSFLATVREIIAWSEESDLTKVGIIGEPNSGKTTLAEAIAHCIHKYSKIPFAVRIFRKEHMLNFRETLSTLTPSNYVLAFDDISFLGADANKKQVDMIKQAETTIRHLPGGQDVKIILIYNYHYTLGLDKYLRQASFYYYTTIGSEEKDNILKIVGKKYTMLVENFKRWRVSAVANKFWMLRIGPKEPFIYKYRNPWIPVLFWNNQTLRPIVSPTRRWLDPICGVCDAGIKMSDVDVGLASVEEIAKRGEKNFDPGNFRAAIKLKLYVNGLTVYGPKIVRAFKYIDKMLAMTPVTLENLAAYYGFEVTNTKLRLKHDDPLKKAAP